MSSHNTSPDMPITVKVTMGADTRRFKMTLREVGPAHFEPKLRELLGLPSNQKVVFERYSDSAGGFMVLDRNNIPVYKQLFRAAKAKTKLRIRATLVEEPQAPAPELYSPPPAPQVPVAPQVPQAPIVAGIPSIPSPAPTQPSAAELDDAVARAVENFCSSESFTSALRDTVRDEVEKRVSEPATSVPDLIALQRSTAELPASVPETADLLGESVQESRYPFAIYCNNCSGNIWRTHYHCTNCDGGDFDLCNDCVQNGCHCSDTKHALNKREFKDGKIIATSEFLRRSSRICNGCAQGVDDSQAVTCQNCKDYDLCISCLRSGDHGHDPSHQLQPADDSVRLTDRDALLLAPGRNVRHEAICDGCDNSIYGIRHKCVDCPDFDYCSKCVLNAPEVHPTHRFVPIYKKNDIAMLHAINPASHAVHYGVYCDGPICGGLTHGNCITGPRYKCVICPNTDFCANCEASPTNTHNATHPLIKIKTPVRMVFVQTTDNTNTVMGDIPAPAPAEKEVATSNAATQVQTVLEVRPVEPKVEEKEVAASDVANQAQTVLEVRPEEPKVEEKQAVEPEKIPEPEQAPVKSTTPLVANFVTDLVADGTVFTVGQKFVQAWFMCNNGTTAWPAGVTVKFVGGDYMHRKSDEASLGATTTLEEVQPGEKAVFSVNLTATYPPAERYISYWRLCAPDGTLFGDNIWCHIGVKPEHEEVAPVEKDTDTAEAKQETEGSQTSSQMIFPKLPFESPSHSVQDLPSQDGAVLVSASPVGSPQTVALDEADLDECSLCDDESFLTDEEYDVLDASDEEGFEECERLSN